ncbi:V/A-type H+-transporting ATPase subunit C [Hathewaya proteolytica DSM 3090]|uniref:V/A-type H+-transporting ATPase subunit C n=1 Tax=Hathewaya proteolytica DSM 3090 TaxID=1121331 RepID=A0A1M6LF96_9CLOT|nr:V-type ATP synthase subunit C [Hathewaya proteolytica]SHJ69901.1 V/A-type H+-transporting ATPase subunit C [Hathewaya proteolytica DSM 3090]
MNRMDFTSAVARLRVLEKRLLNKVKIERMIDAPSAMEALSILGEGEYSALMNDVDRAEDYEVLLQNELQRVYKLMYELTSDNSVVDILSVKYDYHNIKVLIKAKALSSEFNSLLMQAGTVDAGKLKEAIAVGDYKELPASFADAIKEAELKYKETKDPQIIDIIVDRFMYSDMVKRAEDMKEEFILKYVKMNIDFINIRTFLRVKKQEKSMNFLREVLLKGGTIELEFYEKMYSESDENIVSRLSKTVYGPKIKEGLNEYAQTGKLTLFEKSFEDCIMEHVKDGKYINFGPEPLFSYILAKETEIKIIRIIMVAKLNKVQSNVIRERLRDVYV